MYVAPRLPIRVDTASKGVVTLQHLTFRNLRKMWELEKSGTNDWDFMVTSLQLHITDPVTSFADFKAWDRADIERIAREWAANEQVFGKPLAGPNVSQAFVEAFKAAPRTWTRDLKEIAKNAFKILGEHQAIFRQELLQIGPGAEAFQTHLAEITRPLFEELRQLPAQLRDAHGKLAQQGWYMDPDLPFPALWHVADLITDGRPNEARRFLMSHFGGEAGRIEKRLVEEFPHRARVIGAAFRAHKSGEYELSVPVFLAQSDGLAVEFFGRQLFKRKGGLPALNEQLKALAVDSLQATLLYPLASPAPISAAAHERGPDFRGLNRHQVLHGEVTDYATEENSLKAISLLNWVAWTGAYMRNGNAA